MKVREDQKVTAREIRERVQGLREQYEWDGDDRAAHRQEKLLWQAVLVAIAGGGGCGPGGMRPRNLKDAGHQVRPLVRLGEGT